MANSAVVVVGLGAVSPIGLSVAETAAAARARLARLREIEWRDRRFQPFMVGTVPEAGLPTLDDNIAALPLQYRAARLLRLAHVALEQALKPIINQAITLPLLLALPEQHTTQPLIPRDFLTQLVQQTQAPLDLSRSVAVAKGRAAGLMAIQQAMTLLENHRAEFVVVGGVDSLVDLYVLGTLDSQGRIRTEVNSDGFSPSEGAAFVLLTLASTAAQRQLPVFAKVLGSAIGYETGHLYSEQPYLGEGLAATFAQLFTQTPPPAPIACVYASFNGERYWGKEFSVAQLRHSEVFAEQLQMEHPAECCGDLGAAHGVLLLVLAVHGLLKKYRPAPCLVYASSDYGERAAVVLAEG